MNKILATGGREVGFRTYQSSEVQTPGGVCPRGTLKLQIDRRIDPKCSHGNQKFFQPLMCLNEARRTQKENSNLLF